MQPAQVLFLSLRRAIKLFFIMATGNMLLGQARGSVGDLTFYRRSGKQVTRAKATQVSNPKSTAQMIQRMIFATAAAAYSRLRSICDHSFENVQYGAKSQARFMSLNLARLRANYSAPADIDLVDSIAYAARNDAAYSGQGLIIARGSLPEILVSKDDDNDGILLGFGTTIAGATPTISDVLTALNAIPGDQITIVAMQDIGGGDTFTPVIMKSRYVVDANATSEQLATAWDPTGAAAAFDSVKTQVGECRLVSNGAGKPMYVMAAGEEPIAAGVILSRQEGGKWLRSNAVLVNATDEGAWYSVERALPTWENPSTEIETLNDKYLNNADF